MSNRPDEIPEASWTDEHEALLTECKRRHPGFQLTVWKKPGLDPRLRYHFVVIDSDGRQWGVGNALMAPNIFAESSIRHLLEQALRSMDEWQRIV